MPFKGSPLTLNFQKYTGNKISNINQKYWEFTRALTNTVGGEYEYRVTNTNTNIRRTIWKPERRFTF